MASTVGRRANSTGRRIDPPVQVFNPVSVSAISVNDYWVLGYISADSGPNGINIRKTTDAGQHFPTVGIPQQSSRK